MPQRCHLHKGGHGELVHQSALLAAIDVGKLAGFMLDVFTPVALSWEKGRCRERPLPGKLIWPQNGGDEALSFRSVFSPTWPRGIGNNLNYEGISTEPVLNNARATSMNARSFGISEDRRGKYRNRPGSSMLASEMIQRNFFSRISARTGGSKI